MVALVVTFVGVVLFLFSREGSDVSNLTELHLARALELKEAGNQYIVVYEYDYDGQKFYARATRYSKSMSTGSTFAICLDPTDPAQHALTYTDCGPDGPGAPEMGVKEKPEL